MRNFLHRLSVSINLSTRWQTRKKEGIFLELQFVGVRGYGRVEVLKKQATVRKIRYFPDGFLFVIVHFEFI